MRVYSVSLIRTAVTAAKTLLQIKAGATVPLELLRVIISQTSSSTPTMQTIQINRKSVAGTVTSFTPIKLGPTTDPTAAAVGGTAATGVNATVEGTDSDILISDAWNYMIGYLWVPTCKDETIYVGAAGMLGVKFPVAPGASVDITAVAVFRELA